MSIILTGLNTWSADIPTRANVKVLESPMASAITVYQRDIGTSVTGTQYSRFDFGANGNQASTSMPILSAGQNILTGVHADMAAVTASWVVSGHSIEFTQLELMQAEKVGYSQYEVKKDALASVYQRYFTNVMATGVTSVGSTGLINNAAVISAPIKSGTAWATATAEQILGDIAELSAAIGVSNGGYTSPDTLILGATNYGHLTTKVVTNTAVPLLDFVRNTYGITNIVRIPDALALVGGKQRMAMYTNDASLVRAGVADVGTYNWAPTIQGLSYSQTYLFGFGSPEMYDLSTIAYRVFP
jgi:hypothetical protein